MNARVEALEDEVEALRWELAGELARYRQLGDLGRTVEQRLRGEFDELLWAAREARYLFELRREEREAVAAAVASGEDWDYAALREELDRKARPKCMAANLAVGRLESTRRNYPGYLKAIVLPVYDGRAFDRVRRVIYHVHVYAHPERSPNAAAKDTYSRALFRLRCEDVSGLGRAEAEALAFAASADPSPEWTLPEHLPELAAELRHRIGEVREAIRERLESPPWDQLALLEDPEAMATHRDRLRAAAEAYRADDDREAALLDALMGR